MIEGDGAAGRCARAGLCFVVDAEARLRWDFLFGMILDDRSMVLLRSRSTIVGKVRYKIKRNANDQQDQQDTGSPATT